MANGVTLHLGDMLEVLPTLAADSFDAAVCDPPYHLTSIVKRFGGKNAAPAKPMKSGGGEFQRLSRGFMGKQWDGGDIAMRPETWAAVLRVLKPGAHLVAFGGTRTFHRIWCAIEDAGFEIRDSILELIESDARFAAFAASLNAEQLSALEEILGQMSTAGLLAWMYGSGLPKSHDAGNGWGTALKPAFEPIVLARKPLIGTVAANVAAHGTGAINIDGCRTPEGRWSANVIHDGSEEVLAAFPEAPGQIGRARTDGEAQGNNTYGALKHVTTRPEPRGDSGSAARFFYCAKASRADRNEGCDALPDREAGMRNETSGQHITRRDGGDPKPTKNNHPTVKPEALMRYLCRLVTPAGGTILDPFMGSGSTGKAAVLEGFRFTGIEREAEYIQIAQARIAAAQADPQRLATKPRPIKPKKPKVPAPSIFARARTAAVSLFN